MSRAWSRWAVVTALLAHAVLRALVLHTNFDSVAVWMYELSPMGTLAESAIRGFPLPPQIFYANAGGQVLVGYASVPVFWLFGPSYLSLKLVPFLLGSGTLLLVHAFLRDAFGTAAGIVGAWCVALAPTTFLKYSVVCSGNHTENLFLCLAVLVLFQRMHRNGCGRASLFVLGAAAGFALANSFGAAIPLLLLFGVHVGMRGASPAARDLVCIAPGVLVGLSPLLLLEIESRGRGASFLATAFEPGSEAAPFDPGRFLSRFADFLLVRPASAACYPGVARVPGAALGRVFSAGAIAASAAALAIAARRRRSPVAGWLAYLVAAPVLTAAAFGVSKLAIHGDPAASLGFLGFRYFLPSFLYAMLAIAAVAGLAIRRGGIARAGGVLLAATALLPGLANARLVDRSFAHAGIGSKYRGYDLSRIGRALLSVRIGLGREWARPYLERLPPDVRPQVARGLGFNLAVAQLDRRKHEGGERAQERSVDLDALFAGFSVADRAEIARGAGIGARFLRTTGDPRPETVLETIRATARDPRFLEGLMCPNTILPLSANVPELLRLNARLVEAAAADELEPEVVGRLARGQGFLCGLLARRGIRGDLAAVDEALARLAPELRADAARGYEEGLAEPR